MLNNQFFGQAFRVCQIFLALFLFSGCASLQSVFDGTALPARNTPQTARKELHEGKGSQQKDLLARRPIVTRKGVYYFVAPGDTLSGIARHYKINRNDLAQMNDLYDSTLVVGRRLFIPHRKTRHEFLSVTNVIRKETPVRHNSSARPDFVWPLKNYRVTSKFGWRRGRSHEGVDLAVRSGTPIHAAAEGRVIYSKRFAGYGNLIVLRHEGSYFTAYAHAQQLLVPLGKRVRKGQKIATVGRTGRASGPHLHFEIRKGAEAVDPLTVLKKTK